MNRLVPGMLMIGALALSACSQPDTAAQATLRAANMFTAVAQTMVVLPTLTNPPTNTSLPTSIPSASSAPASATPIPSQTPTVTSTPGTGTVTVSATPSATGSSATPTRTATGATGTATATASATRTVTGTPPTATSAVTGTPPTATATDLMVTRVYGTQPPYVEYGRIELSNQSKTQVYISFQCTTPEGYQVIEEYPVTGTFKVSIAAGHCQYVAWIGGKEFTGEFSLKRFEELTFIFKKTGIEIK